MVHLNNIGDEMNKIKYGLKIVIGLVLLGLFPIVCQAENAVYDLFNKPSLLGEYNGETKRVKCDANGRVLVAISSTTPMIVNSSATIAGKLTVGPGAGDDNAMEVYQSTHGKGINLYGYDTQIGKGLEIKITNAGTITMTGVGGNDMILNPNMYKPDSTKIYWGSLSTFSQGFYSQDKQLQIVRGSTLNVNPIITISTFTSTGGTGSVAFPAGEVKIGHTATPQASLDLRGLGGSSNYVVFMSTSADGVGYNLNYDNSGNLIVTGNTTGIIAQGGGLILKSLSGTVTSDYLAGQGVASYLRANTGANLAIGTDTSADAKLEVIPDAGDTYAFLVSSQNASTDLVSVDNLGILNTSFGINNVGSYSVLTATTSANFTFGTGNFQNIIISSAGVTGTLPAISGVRDGRTFECKNIGLAAVTINPTGADKIDDSSSDSIPYLTNAVYTANRILNVWIKR